jgi:hypothetical protein
MNLHEDINRIKEVMGVSSIDEVTNSKDIITYDEETAKGYGKVLNMFMSKFDWWKGIDVKKLSYNERRNKVIMSGILDVDKDWAINGWKKFSPNNKGSRITLTEVISAHDFHKLEEEFSYLFNYTFGVTPYSVSYDKIFLNLIPTESIQEQEKPRKDLSDLIKKSLEPLIERKKHIVCDIEITAPWNRETVEPDKSFEHYKILVTFIGGHGSKYWPATLAVNDKYDAIMNEVWHTIYDYFGIASDIYSKRVKTCDTIEKEEETEGVGAYAAPAFEMKPDHVHFKNLYNENEDKESKVDALKELVKNVGYNTASKMVGGTENLINILFDGDIMNYYKETGFAPVRISADGMNMYIDDLIVSTLGLEPKSGLMKDEVGLGNFKWKSGGMTYKFTANIRSFESQNNGQKLWRVVGTCGDSGFGYAYIPQRQVIGKRGRQQIFKQIIDKYGLQRFL